MLNNLTSTQSQSHALILGKALLCFNPESQLLDYSVLGSLFSYQVLLAKDHDIHVDLLEQKMSQLIEEKEEFYPLEMIYSSAHELFMCHGQKLRAEYLDEEPLFNVVKIGDYFDLLKQKSLKEPKGLFKIVKVEKKQEYFDSEKREVTTIVGVWASEKKDLKNQCKSFRQKEKFYSKPLEHILIKSGSAVLKGHVLKQREEIEAKLCNNFEAEGFEKISCLDVEKPQVYFEKQMPRKFFWTKVKEDLNPLPLQDGLKALSFGTQNLFIIRTNSEDLVKDSIYCLKFYLKTIKILGFSYKVESFAKKDALWMQEVLASFEDIALEKCDKKNEIRFYLEDCWGHLFATMSFKIENRRGLVWIEGEMPSFEKLLAAQIEQTANPVRDELPSAEPCEAYS